jgi:hypothetical protein
LLLKLDGLLGHAETLMLSPLLSVRQGGFACLSLTLRSRLLVPRLTLRLAFGLLAVTPDLPLALFGGNLVPQLLALDLPFSLIRLECRFSPVPLRLDGLGVRLGLSVDPGLLQPTLTGQIIIAN